MAAAESLAPAWGLMLRVWAQRSVRQAAITHPTCEATAAWQPGASPESRTVLSRLAQLVPLDATAPLFGSLKHPGRPMEERELHTLWHRTLTRARVRPRPPETLRHSCISSLLSRGGPLLYVAQQSGHSPRVMLASYARWQEQGAKAVTQPDATQPQPAPRLATLNSAS